MVSQERWFLHTQRTYSSVASTICNPAISVDRKTQPSGHNLRTEPSNIEWMQKLPQALETVKKMGWYNMFERITEHHVEVTKAFCQVFNGSRVRIGGLSFIVIEETISHAIGVLQEGETWYKRKTINEDYSQ